MNDTFTVSFDSYQTIHKNIGKILSQYPSSRAYFDYYRSPKAREAYDTWEKGKVPSKANVKAFMTIAMRPTHAYDLTQAHFKRLYEIYGDAAIKVAMVDQNFLQWLETAKPDEQVLSTGGSCALESIDTRHIAYLKRRKGGDELVKSYVESVFMRFPTWTQVTGSLLPKNGVSVFYDETFPWHLKMKEYGIKNAQIMTQRIYDRIYNAVLRFIKLHNPQNVAVRVPFFGLNLAEGGQFDRWFEDYKMYINQLEESLGLESGEYNQNEFYRSWIEYTYMGPEILQTTLALIKKQYGDIYESYNLERSTIHVRGKQIDHFDTERQNQWIHEALFHKNLAKDKRFQHLLRIPIHRHGLAKYMWMRDKILHTPSIGSAGFLDFNFRGSIAHEFNFLPTLPANKMSDPDALLDTPLRLHSRNIDDVIQFLDRYKNPYSVSFSKQLLVSLSELNDDLTKMNKKIEILRTYTEYSDFFIKLFAELAVEQSDLEEKSSSQIQEMMDFLITRYRNDMSLIQLVQQNGDRKQQAKDLLEKELSALFTFKKTAKGITITVQNMPLMKKWLSLLQKYNPNDKERIKAYTQKRDTIQDSINKNTQNISENILKHKADYLSSYVNILPLADNIFVSYMQQLIFIPSIQEAYQDIVSVAFDTKKNKETKEKIIIEIISAIFPIVKDCLEYLLKPEMSYPWQARFEARYKRPY